MTYRDFLRGGLSEVLLGVLFVLFTLIGLQHPSPLVYLVVGFALLAIGSALYSFRLLRQQLSLQKGQGQRFGGGERAALPNIQDDMLSMVAGDTVTICGTGATAIAHIANDVYGALRREVSLVIYVIHPKSPLVDYLAKMEADFELQVFNPFVQSLKNDHDLRKLLGAEWTNSLLGFLTHDSKLCGQPAEEHICSLHGRIIWASAEIWKRVAELVSMNDPSIHSGQLRVCFYRRIPFIKAWKFRKASGGVWYYATDYLYYPGVGIDNPIRRVEKTSQLNQHDTDAPGFINLDRIDAHLEFIDGDSEVWELKPQEKPGELDAGPALNEQRPVNRKPDKPSPARSASSSAELSSNKSRKGTP